VDDHITRSFFRGCRDDETLSSSSFSPTSAMRAICVDDFVDDEVVERLIVEQETDGSEPSTLTMVRVPWSSQLIE
jgi:hypothetical protein